MWINSLILFFFNVWVVIPLYQVYHILCTRSWTDGHGRSSHSACYWLVCIIVCVSLCVGILSCLLSRWLAWDCWVTWQIITCREIVQRFPKGLSTREVSLGQPNGPFKGGGVMSSSANPPPLPNPSGALDEKLTLVILPLRSVLAFLWAHLEINPFYPGSPYSSSVSPVMLQPDCQSSPGPLPHPFFVATIPSVWKVPTVPK